MLLRWLLPVMTVLAVLASSVTAYASSGIIGEAACCCPVKKTCKCHDHDGGKQPDTQMKRCGGDAKLVAPNVTPAIAVTAATPEIETVVVEIVIAATLPMPPSRSDRPEKPPF